MSGRRPCGFDTFTVTFFSLAQMKPHRKVRWDKLKSKKVEEQWSPTPNQPPFIVLGCGPGWWWEMLRKDFSQWEQFDMATAHRLIFLVKIMSELYSSKFVSLVGILFHQTEPSASRLFLEAFQVLNVSAARLQLVLSTSGAQAHSSWFKLVGTGMEGGGGGTEILIDW